MGYVRIVGERKVDVSKYMSPPRYLAGHHALQ